MKVLILHNFYQERGGEDSVVKAEADLLLGCGQEVETYFRHNDELKGTSALVAAVETFWSRRSFERLTDVIRRFQPDILHVHNTFPVTSPSVYWAAYSHRVPVVQTLHNFRLLCSQAQFLRDGMICEKCIGTLPWRGVVHGCYRGSRTQSFVSVASLAVHRAIGTYHNKITTYIALNEFCSSKFIQGGLPASRVRIKPNFVQDPGESDVAEPRSGGVYIGRLSKDKGMSVLLAAASLLCARSMIVAGVGEYEDAVREQFRDNYVGFRDLQEILQLMKRAAYLVVPSLWYENFPRTIVEAYACGLPVIASRVGALAEIVVDGQTGLLFEVGRPDDLARKMRWADEHPDEMLRMGSNARAMYVARYSPSTNYSQLLDIYRDAIQKASFH